MRRPVPPLVKQQIILSGPCVYCGGIATCVDHVVPVAQGGTNDLSNLAPACRDCNLNKLDFTPEQWREWRLSEGMPWPPQSYGDFVSDRIAEWRAAHPGVPLPSFTSKVSRVVST